MDLFSVLSLLGGLALFLYGMQVMSDGLKKVSGGKLESTLENLTSNRWKGMLLGLGVTAVIQSSSATTVMVVGLVNSGIMKLTQAVGVILGANIGTTVTAWILSLTGIKSSNIFIRMFNPTSFSPIIAIIGVFTLMISKNEKKRGISVILVGFAVLMFGMDAMSSAVAPLSSDEQFIRILTMFSNPFLGMMAGLVLTLIIQSSSASIGILQALSLSGTVQIGMALPVLMGENLGTAITAILASIGTSKNARRAALIHLYFCLIKTTTFMVLFYSVNAFVHFTFLTEIATPLTIAVIHSVFNVTSVLIMMPISDLLVKLALKTVPITEEERREAEIRKPLPKLDPLFYSTPSFALERSHVSACEMAGYAEQALNEAMDLMNAYSLDGAAHVEQLEQLVDRYDDQLENYLANLSRQTLSIQESQTLSILLHCVNDIERISDHALNISQSAGERARNGHELPQKAQNNLNVFARAVRDIMHISVSAFSGNDLSLARSVEPLEEVIDDLDIEVKRRIRRMRKGKGTVELGFILSDAATDYERVADHCSNIAVSLLQTEISGYGAHEYLDKVKNPQNEEFQKQVLYFQNKYMISKGRDEDETDEIPEEESEAKKKDVKKLKKADGKKEK